VLVFAGPSFLHLLKAQLLCLLFLNIIFRSSPSHLELIFLKLLKVENAQNNKQEFAEVSSCDSFILISSQNIPNLKKQSSLFRSSFSFKISVILNKIQFYKDFSHFNVINAWLLNLAAQNLIARLLFKIFKIYLFKLFLKFLSYNSISFI
jgi:hypothetical protein